MIRRTAFRYLSEDEQTLVRLAERTARTKRSMLRETGWSSGKFSLVQRELVSKGWPIKPSGEKVKITFRGRVVHRPLYRLLKEEEHFIASAKMESDYNITRTATGQAVQRRGEVENPTSEAIFDAEQQLKVANNVLRGEQTPVPVGTSENDSPLKTNGHILTQDELEEELASLLKQHPRNR